MLRKLEKYDLAWVEEPPYPDDFEGFKILIKNVETPNSAGEYLTMSTT